MTSSASSAAPAAAGWSHEASAASAAHSSHESTAAAATDSAACAATTPASPAAPLDLIDACWSCVMACLPLAAYCVLRRCSQRHSKLSRWSSSSVALAQAEITLHAWTQRDDAGEMLGDEATLDQSLAECTRSLRGALAGRLRSLGFAPRSLTLCGVQRLFVRQPSAALSLSSEETRQRDMLIHDECRDAAVALRAARLEATADPAAAAASLARPRDDTSWVHTSHPVKQRRQDDAAYAALTQMLLDVAGRMHSSHAHCSGDSAASPSAALGAEAQTRATADDADLAYLARVFSGLRSLTLRYSELDHASLRTILLSFRSTLHSLSFRDCRLHRYTYSDRTLVHPPLTAIDQSAAAPSTLRFLDLRAGMPALPRRDNTLKRRIVKETTDFLQTVPALAGDSLETLEFDFGRLNFRLEPAIQQILESEANFPRLRSLRIPQLTGSGFSAEAMQRMHGVAEMRGWLCAESSHAPVRDTQLDWEHLSALCQQLATRDMRLMTERLRVEALRCDRRANLCASNVNTA